MIKWSKLIGAGIAVSVIRYVFSSTIGYQTQGLYDPISGLWRAMMTPAWVQNVILAHVIIAFLTVFAYALVHTGLGKKAEIGKKGAKFAMVVWILSDIPGSLLTFVFMPVSFTLVMVWIASGLVLSLINGQVIARIYK